MTGVQTCALPIFEQRSAGPGLSAGLWSTSADGCKIIGADHDCIRLTEVGVDTKGDTHTVIDVDLGVAGSDLYNGAVMGDCTGDHVMVAYTRSGVTQFPTAEIDGLTTPAVMGAGIWGHSRIPFASGTQAYVNTPTAASNGQQRWGDYANIFPEDSCGLDGWAVAEFGSDQSINGASRWESALGEFTFDGPAVTLVLPGQGSAGTTVDITGTGFTKSSFVAFGSTPATSMKFLGSDHLQAVAPPHAAGTVDVTVTTLLGTTATHFSDHFTYPALAWLTTTGGIVDVFDTNANNWIQRIPDLAGTPGTSIALTPDAATAFVTSGTTPWLYEFSGATYKFQSKLALIGAPPASLPRTGDFVAGAPDGLTAYVSSTAAGMVEVIDVATNADVAEIPVGTDPTQIAVTPDNTRA